MNEFDFSERLMFSRGVRETTDLAAIQQMIPGCYEVRRAELSDDRRGVDYWAYIKNGRPLAIDAKARKGGCARWWKGEPDLALEHYSVMPRGSRAGVIGWTLDPAKLTDLVLFTYDPVDTLVCYLLGLPKLRIAFMRHGIRWCTQYKRDTQTTRAANGRSAYKSQCVFVPASEVLSAMQQVSVGTLPAYTEAA